MFPSSSSGRVTARAPPTLSCTATIHPPQHSQAGLEGDPAAGPVPVGVRFASHAQSVTAHTPQEQQQQQELKEQELKKWQTGSHSCKSRRSSSSSSSSSSKMAPRAAWRSKWQQHRRAAAARAEAARAEGAAAAARAEAARAEAAAAFACLS